MNPNMKKLLDEVLELVKTSTPAEKEEVLVHFQTVIIPALKPPMNGQKEMTLQDMLASSLSEDEIRRRVAEAIRSKPTP